MPISRPTLTKLAERGIKDQSSPVATFSPESQDENFKYFVAWDERYDAAYSICGKTEIERGMGGAPVRLMRLTPMPHPTLTGWYADAVTDMRGFGPLSSTVHSSVVGDAHVNRYSKAEITVRFKRFLGPVAEDDTDNITAEYKRMFWLDSVQESVEAVRAPIGTLKFKDATTNANVDGKIVPTGQLTIVPTVELTWIWDHLPLDLMNLGDPLANRIWGKTDGSALSYLGSLNKYAWPGSTGFAPGTLLLTGYRPIRVPSAIGIPTLQVKITTMFKPTKGGWNFLQYFDPEGTNTNFYFVSRASGTPTYYAPGSVPDNTSIYNERDWSGITKVQA